MSSDFTAVMIPDGLTACPSPLEAVTTSSPAKSADPGLIRLLIADACLASIDTILPARTR
jgi:hypothetical protein